MTNWKIDPDHSCAAFAIRHMALAHVRGQFTSVSGSIRFDPENRKDTSVYVEISVSSVNTGNKTRDAHLLTADFFDETRYPRITFRSTKIEFLGVNRCRVTGDLTLHGMTRQVTLEGEYAGPHGNPYGEEISVGFSGSVRINREDFGMMWGSEPMKGGGFVVGKEVDLFLDVEADKE